jgi:hypothetical protein
MKEELKLLGLTPLFGLVGAIATASVWHVYAATIVTLVPQQLTLLACFAAGLFGPPIVWACLWLATRPVRRSVWDALRGPATTGLGLVFATQLAFYIPIGFFTIAFHYGTLQGL